MLKWIVHTELNRLTVCHNRLHPNAVLDTLAATNPSGLGASDCRGESMSRIFAFVVRESELYNGDGDLLSKEKQLPDRDWGCWVTFLCGNLVLRSIREIPGFARSHSAGQWGGGGPHRAGWARPDRCLCATRLGERAVLHRVRAWGWRGENDVPYNGFVDYTYALYTKSTTACRSFMHASSVRPFLVVAVPSATHTLVLGRSPTRLRQLPKLLREPDRGKQIRAAAVSRIRAPEFARNMEAFALDVRTTKLAC